MTRSTQAQKVERLNAAQRLLSGGSSMAENAQKLSRDYALSLRQAYRYLEEAQAIGHPTPVPEPSIATTFKIPRTLIRDLHAYSAASGLTLSEIVRRALVSFLSTVSRRG
jgi:predicted DNA-binding transcriptional regulator YafY